jgi:putative HIT family protein
MTESSADLCGVPDAFQRLWTPHRMVYIEGNKPRDENSCPFCIAPTQQDEDGLIVARGEHAFVVMNLFPYSPGHLLVCPYRHVSGYVDATTDETREIAELTQRAIAVLAEVSQPAGFNIGMNQGAVAGAGISAHLHQHVVPRWAGDMNFMPIIGQTRALPQLLGDARERLAEAWAPMA